MATKWLQVCDNPPNCPSATWTEVHYVEPVNSFDPATLDAEILAQAFAVGFIVMGTGLLMAWAVRMIISLVHSS